MWYSLASFFFAIACAITSFSANSYSYLAEDVNFTHGALSVLCLIFFLLGIVVAVLANTDNKGRVHSPQSLSTLVCLILLVPQGGFTIGLLVNLKSSIEIMSAVQESSGATVYSSQGLVVLDGEIGHNTLSSLKSVMNQESLSTLLLKSNGGLIAIGIEIGEILKDNRMDVLVTENCESACVIVALSGTRLFAAPNARFGFHRGSAVASNDSQLGRYIGNVATKNYISALEALNVPDSILNITEKTGWNEMYYLSGEQMVQNGLAHHYDNRNSREERDQNR